MKFLIPQCFGKLRSLLYLVTPRNLDRRVCKLRGDGVVGFTKGRGCGRFHHSMSVNEVKVKSNNVYRRDVTYL